MHKYKRPIGYKAALIALLKKYGNHSVFFVFAKKPGKLQINDTGRRKFGF
jgi:hypothetical protein